jgi:hypothetical protein
MDSKDDFADRIVRANGFASGNLKGRRPASNFIGSAGGAPLLPGLSPSVTFPRLPSAAGLMGWWVGACVRAVLSGGSRRGSADGSCGKKTGRENAGTACPTSPCCAVDTEDDNALVCLLVAVVSTSVLGVGLLPRRLPETENRHVDDCAPPTSTSIICWHVLWTTDGLIPSLAVSLVPCPARLPLRKLPPHQPARFTWAPASPAASHPASSPTWLRHDDNQMCASAPYAPQDSAPGAACRLTPPEPPGWVRGGPWPHNRWVLHASN